MQPLDLSETSLAKRERCPCLEIKAPGSLFPWHFLPDRRALQDAVPNPGMDPVPCAAASAPGSMYHETMA